MTTFPPRVPVTLRVGVTGHRPDAAKRVLPDVTATRAVIAGVLSVIQQAVEMTARDAGDLFAATDSDSTGRSHKRVRVLSALAPGPDQWVADEAVSHGYELQCVLPFSRDEYRTDVRQGPDNSERDYVRLLASATAVLELDGRVAGVPDGERSPDRLSYLDAGRAILRQSDLLIAVWDGQPARGTGGTGQIVDEALARGIPIVWLPWGSIDRWTLLLPSWRNVQETDASAPVAERLTKLVQGLLLPADESDPPKHQTDLRSTYFAERHPRGNPLHACWGTFTAIVCGATARRPLDRRVPADHRAPDSERDILDRAFGPHYTWANSLSVYYGKLHRGAVVVTSLLGAVAVFLALVTIASGITGHGQAWWIVAELGVILSILGLTRVGRLRHWHQRWIDYRTLAERLRLSSGLGLLGGGYPLVLHAGHLASYGNPLRTWMHWHAMAIERAAGLLPAKITHDYMAACREFWTAEVIEDQRAYHEATEAMFSTLDRRLHRAGDSLFVLTLVACALHLVHLGVESQAAAEWIPAWIPGWLTLFCAFLPAAGAACATIRSQAEAQRVSQRSRAMRDALASLQADFAVVDLNAGAASYQRLRDCADRASELMIRETLDWRVVFQDRPLNLPG